MLGEYRFNFTQLNAKASNLDLMVNTTQKLKIAIGEEAR